ncbi:NUMOD4 domain-containing protein [Sutcliffiella cohnii]
MWKSIPGYDEVYEVSDKGDVRSKDRLVKTNIRNVKERLLKGKILK